jgi:hypothetical protein
LDRDMTQDQHSAPEGLKLVPVEPTPEMFEAARKYWFSLHKGAAAWPCGEAMGIYAAMLAAAPQPPAPQAEAAPATAAHAGERVIAWIRFLRDGLYEGPIMDCDKHRMEEIVRPKQSEWTALVAGDSTSAWHAGTILTIERVREIAENIRGAEWNENRTWGQGYRQDAQGKYTIPKLPLVFDDFARALLAAAPVIAPVADSVVTLRLTHEQVSALYLHLVHRTRPDFGWIEAPLVAIEEALKPAHHAIHDRSFNAMNRQFFGDDRMELGEAPMPTEARAAAPVSVDEQQTQAARDVLAERARQVTAEGWTPEHDDKHSDGDLERAAAAYILQHFGVPVLPRNEIPAMGGIPLWPWHPSWWKPGEPRRDLVKAGALILAEIERIDRAAATNTGADHPCAITK